MIFANPASKPQNLSSRKLPETVSLDKKERQRERDREKTEKNRERERFQFKQVPVVRGETIITTYSEEYITW